MNAGRVLLAAVLAVAFGALWVLLRRGPRAARAGTAGSVRGVLRGASAFLALLFLLKIVPALVPPRGLLRDDFLFPLWALPRPATAWWWFAPALGCAAGLVAFGRRAATGTLAALGALALVCALWTSLALTNDGYPDGLIAPFLRAADYQADVARFTTFGEIWNGYTVVQPELSIHGRTHPPGAVSLLWILTRAGGGRLPLVCFAVVLIGALGLVPLRFWTRRLLTEPESRAACLLWIFTPAVTLYGATCMDMVFGLVLGSALATFVAAASPPASVPRGGSGRGVRLGVLLGLELAAGFLLTFTTAVLALTLVLAAAWSVVRREPRAPSLATAAGVAAAVSSVCLLALGPLAGFDWLACVRTAIRLDGAEASAFLSAGYYAMTRLMDVLDFLLLAGVAMTPIVLNALRRGFPVRRRDLPDTRDDDAFLLLLVRSSLVAMGVFFLLGAYKIGETGRIFLFFMPLLAATAARRLGPSSPGAEAQESAAAGLAVICLQFAQTLMMQGFLDTRW